MAGNDADARFWDRIARKYAADPIKDMDGYPRTLDRTRHYLHAPTPCSSSAAAPAPPH